MSHLNSYPLDLFYCINVVQSWFPSRASLVASRSRRCRLGVGVALPFVGPASRCGPAWFLLFVFSGLCCRIPRGYPFLCPYTILVGPISQSFFVPVINFLGRETLFKVCEHSFKFTIFCFCEHLFIYDFFKIHEHLKNISIFFNSDLLNLMKILTMSYLSCGPSDLFYCNLCSNLILFCLLRASRVVAMSSCWPVFVRPFLFVLCFIFSWQFSWAFFAACYWRAL